MFRAAALLIVLTVAVGPSAGLLCTSWCSPRAAAVSGCHHASSGGIVTVVAAARCDRSIVDPGVFLKQDVQRGTAASDSGHGVLAPRQLATRTLACHDWRSVMRATCIKRPALATTLRI